MTTTMTLTIEDPETLDPGQPAHLELVRHGAIIGRSPHADWSLPDARNLISSRHCEIIFRDGEYLLADHSTNGTHLNGSTERVRSPQALAHGDRFTIGHYVIVAALSNGTATIASPSVEKEDSWERFPSTDHHTRAGEPDEGWAPPPDQVSGAGGHWRSRDPQPVATPSAGTWDLPAPITRPSSWSSEPREATTPTADDVWGRLNEQSDIDWSRGNFAAPPPATGGWGAVEMAAGDRRESERADWGSEVLGSKLVEAEVTAEDETRAAKQSVASDGWLTFLEAGGIPSDRIRRSPTEALSAAGAILRQMVSGLMLMIEARARAKAQLGVQATGLELDGNNPLKFVRSPERALLQLLDEPQEGFMGAERAVEDVFQDLQAHQMATLSAMRGALDGTLSRCSPSAIRDRSGEPTRWTRWFSVVRRARQWDAYEREFEGVVRGANDAFMDLFAKEFRQHYDRQISEMKSRPKQ